MLIFISVGFGFGLVITLSSGYCCWCPQILDFVSIKVSHYSVCPLVCLPRVRSFSSQMLLLSEMFSYSLKFLFFRLLVLFFFLFLPLITGSVRFVVPFALFDYIYISLDKRLLDQFLLPFANICSSLLLIKAYISDSFECHFLSSLYIR